LHSHSLHPLPTHTPPPPPSTPFPYTTLFRSPLHENLSHPPFLIAMNNQGSDPGLYLRIAMHILDENKPGQALRDGPIGVRDVHRSEEHTSELKSLRHLVCRLLLEKKKHILDN